MEENLLDSERVMTFVSRIPVNVSPAKQDLRLVAAKCTSDISATYWWWLCGGGVLTSPFPYPVLPPPVPLSSVASDLLPFQFRCSRLHINEKDLNPS